MLNQPHPRNKVDWEQYQALDPEGKRYELIDGELHEMASAPRIIHQELLGAFYVEMVLALKRKPCKVFLAPCDVKLSNWDVVQPDLLVVCKRDQLLVTHVEGPPQIAVEILSPSSIRHDRIRKLRQYAKFQIPEYWIVAPDPAMVEVLLLDGETYRTVGSYYPTSGRLRSPSIPDLDLDLAALFEPAGPGPADEVREVSPEYLATLLTR